MTDTETTQALSVAKTPEGNINAFGSLDAFRTAQRMATALSCSLLVPQEYRGDNGLPNIMIAMEIANRTGASVFSVMQNLDIIHGRPSFRATFLIATVNSSGNFTPLRFRWEGEAGTPARGCRAVARDKDTDEECIGALITMGMANAEGWSKKKGSKWLTMPEQMLMYRAAAFWTRVYAPEQSLGMLTREEAKDIGYVEADSPRGASSLASRLQLGQPVEVEVEATLAPDSIEPPASEATPEPDEEEPDDDEPDEEAL